MPVSAARLWNGEQDADGWLEVFFIDRAYGARVGADITDHTLGGCPVLEQGCPCRWIHTPATVGNVFIVVLLKNSLDKSLTITIAGMQIIRLHHLPFYLHRSSGVDPIRSAFVDFSTAFIDSWAMTVIVACTFAGIDLLEKK